MDLRLKRAGAAAILAALVAFGSAGTATAAPGDVYFTEPDTVPMPGNAGRVLLLPAGGGLSPLAMSQSPNDIALSSGQVYVAEPDPPVGSGAVMSLSSGSLLPVSSGPPLQTPFSLARDPDGSLLVADIQDGSGFGNGVLIRVHPGSPPQLFVSPGVLDKPVGIDVLPSRDTLVADPGNDFGGGENDGRLLRVNPAGQVSLLASGLNNPTAVVGLPGSNSALVVDRGSFGAGIQGRLVRVNLDTGAVQLLVASDDLRGASGVAVDPEGRAIVAAGTSEVLRFDLGSGARQVLGMTQGGLLGGVAVDPPLCQGKPATIFGGPDTDRIAGSNLADVTTTLGGPDEAQSGDGDDLLCLGADRDTGQGGIGRDELFGEEGRDLLKGGKGRDRLVGGPGRDKLVGGKGRDRLRGGKGRDVCVEAGTKRPC